MSRPLRDDGTHPLKPRMQLVLRVTGEQPVEAVREIKLTWGQEQLMRMSPGPHGWDADPRQEMIDILADELDNVITPSMLGELLAQAQVRGR